MGFTPSFSNCSNWYDDGETESRTSCKRVWSAFGLEHEYNSSQCSKHFWNSGSLSPTDASTKDAWKAMADNPSQYIGEVKSDGGETACVQETTACEIAKVIKIGAW